MKVKFVLKAGEHCQGCFGTVPSQWKMVPAQIFKGSRFEFFCNDRQTGERVMIHMRKFAEQ